MADVFKYGTHQLYILDNVKYNKKQEFMNKIKGGFL